MKKLTLFLSLFTLLLLPASQTIEAQQLGQRVYWMATIEVPASHQGSERPPMKNSVMEDPARRDIATPIPVANTK